MLLREFSSADKEMKEACGSDGGLGSECLFTTAQSVGHQKLVVLCSLQWVCIWNSRLLSCKEIV